MRKKTIVWAYLIVLSLGTILSLYIPKNQVAAKNAIIIPGQAIRLRILANSDLDSDQALKRDVRDAVNAKISVWVKDLTSFSKAQKVIKSKIPEIQATAEAVVKKEHSTQSVKVQFSKNVQFPTKLYGQFLYPAGKYQAVLITLGAGKGANWWCVLFPPLCFLDFSNGIAVSQGFDGQQQEPASGKKNAAAHSEAAAKNTSHSLSTAEASAQKAQSSASRSNSSAQETYSSKLQSSAQNGQSTDSRWQSPVQSSVQDTQGAAIKSKDTSAAKKSVQTASEQQTNSEKAQSDLPAKHDKKHTAPVYTSQDEQPVKVKFFVVELWDKLFN
jgi:stage II sporulation protein R